MTSFGGLNAGDLRHRVTWQRSAPTRNAMGQDIPDWKAVGTYWGRVQPLTGRELVNAQQIRATIGHKITLRNVGAISPQDRFLFEGTGRVFNVDSVVRRDEQNVALDLLCSELVAS